MKKLNLSKLNHEVLTDLEMFQIRGTGTSKSGSSTPSCSCACKYANKGGSSTSDNGSANKAISSTPKGDTSSTVENQPKGGWKTDWGGEAYY